MDTASMIKKVKEEISNFVKGLCDAKPDKEILECSVNLENEFRTLEKSEKKDTMFSNAVKAISSHINFLIEKFSDVCHLTLKLSYLRERFNLMIECI